MQMAILRTVLHYRNLHLKHLKINRFRAIWAKDRYSIWTKFSKCSCRYSKLSKSWLLPPRQQIRIIVASCTILLEILIKVLWNQPELAANWTRFNLKVCTFILIRIRIPSTSAWKMVHHHPREVMAVKVNQPKTFILCKWVNTHQVPVLPQLLMLRVLHHIQIICKHKIYNRLAKAKKCIQVVLQVTWRTGKVLRNRWSMLAPKNFNQWILLATFQLIKWYSNLRLVKIHRLTTLVNYRYNPRVVETLCRPVSNNIIS